jgi:hypothetical protein
MSPGEVKSSNTLLALARDRANTGIGGGPGGGGPGGGPGPGPGLGPGGAGPGPGGPGAGPVGAALSLITENFRIAWILPGL